MQNRYCYVLVAQKYISTVVIASTSAGLTPPAGQSMMLEADALAQGYTYIPLPVINPTYSLEEKNKLAALNLPLTLTYKKTVPSILAGAAFAFDVPFPGVTTDMNATANCPDATIADSIYGVNALIVAADKVHLTVQARAALAAGERTFKIRIFV